MFNLATHFLPLSVSALAHVSYVCMSQPTTWPRLQSIWDTILTSRHASTLTTCKPVHSPLVSTTDTIRRRERIWLVLTLTSKHHEEISENNIGCRCQHVCFYQ